ncbi:hypothetical protein BX616_008526 [Lobosporangium transversale]|nr:hypothetical protein BX616_008526 [Lobosporangium transversale]
MPPPQTAEAYPASLCTNDTTSIRKGTRMGMGENLLPAATSYYVSLGYIGLLLITAIIICYRARTRLRLYACFSTFLAFSIAIMGAFNVNRKVPSNAFWLWNFAAESIGMVALTYAIVSVGNGFYPMAGKKNIFWRLAMAWIIIYALVASGNIVSYLYQKVIYHHISPISISPSRNMGILDPSDANALHLGLGLLLSLYPLGSPSSPELCRQAHRQRYDGRRRLAYAILNIYFCNKIEDIFEPSAQALDLCIRATTNPIFFLPAPAFLIRFYRKRFNRLVKGNSVGGGSRYGGSRYGGSSSRKRNGSAGCVATGDFGGGFGGGQDSFIHSENRNGTTSSPYSPIGSRLGGRSSGDKGDQCSLPRDSVDGSVQVNPCHSFTDDGSSHNNYYTNSHNSNNHGNHHTSISNAYSRLRLFQSRNRGASMESNRVFNQDFNQEDGHQHGHARSDSFDQYYSNMGRASAGARGSDEATAINQASSSHFSNNSPNKDPLAGLRPSSMEPLQKPEPALTSASASQMNNSWKMSRFMNNSLSDADAAGSDSGSVPEEKCAIPDEAVPSKDGVASSSNREKYEDTAEIITGTTGWEVGGWGHIRKTSQEGIENSLSSPLELCPPSLDTSTTASNATVSLGQYSEGPSTIANTAVEVDSYGDLLDTYSASGGFRSGSNSRRQQQKHQRQQRQNQPQELTGLQKQLAEYRSALLPVVLAMQDMDDYSPSSSAFDMYESTDNNSKRNPGNSRRLDVLINHSGSVRTSHDDLPSNRQYYAVGGIVADKIDEWSEPPVTDHREQPLSAHSDGPMHWTRLSTSPSSSTSSAFDYNNSDSVRNQSSPSNYRSIITATTATNSNTAEKSMSGFRKKWLVSRNKNDTDRTGPPKKFELESSMEETKSSRRNSHLISGLDNALVYSKGNKPKEVPRRGVFSKLSGGVHKSNSGDRSRPSQDFNEQDNDYKIVDGGDLKSPHGGSTIPATVEALALETTLGNLEEEDEDKGLQYYYPDPYYSLAEFKRPNQVSAGISSNSSSNSSSHPRSINTIDSGFLSKTSSPSSPLASDSLLTMASPLEDPMDLYHNSIRSPSIKTKSSTSSKKSSKKDSGLLSSPGLIIPANAIAMAPSSSYSGSASATTMSPISSPTTTPTHQTSSSTLGSLLSRSSSNSRRLSSKAKARGNRSKSDTAPSRPSIDVTQIPVPVATVAANAAFATATVNTSAPLAVRKPSIPEVSPQTSLSPPPRQSWNRSKSFQGTASAITAALLSSRPDASNGNVMYVDTKLANEHRPGPLSGSCSATGLGFSTPLAITGNGADSGNESSLPSSGGTRSSLSSSLGSVSPAFAPTAPNDEYSNTNYKESSPSSPSPLSPPIMTSSSKTGDFKPRTSTPVSLQDHRSNSMDRGRDRDSNNSLRDRTAALRATANHQRSQPRSVDNLASAYYFKRATPIAGDINSNNNSSSIDTNVNDVSKSQESVNVNVSTPVPRSPSPQLVGAGFSYYGGGSANNGFGGEDSHGRNSPTSQQQQHPLFSSSPSQNNYSHGHSYFPRGKTSLDYSGGGGLGVGLGIHHSHSHSPSPSSLRAIENSTPVSDSSRSNSITNNNSLLMADDPWTMAMVARAKNANA